MKNKHVVISPEVFTQLESLSDNWKMDKKEFLENIINYFRVTGEDPTASKKDNTVKAIKQLQNTLVSFIKKHETDHLMKITEDFEATRRALFEEQKNNQEKSQKSFDGLNKTMTDLIYAGVDLKAGGKWSLLGEIKAARTDIKDISKRDEALINYQKKLNELKATIEVKRKEIEAWNMLSGNKDKANSILTELLSLL